MRPLHSLRRQAFLLSDAARCVYATTRPFNGLQTWAHIASHTPEAEANMLRFAAGAEVRARARIRCVHLA